MTEKSVADEDMPCQSKIGRAIRPIGKQSAMPSESDPDTGAKAAQVIQSAEPSMESATPSPEDGLLLLSPTSTITLKTALRKTSAPGASDATFPTTPSATHSAPDVQKTLPAITRSRRSLSGANNKLTRQQLLQAIQGDELALQQHAILLEAYKPTMDAIKLYLEIHGSQSPNFYMTKNKQVAAACQMNGLNDPSATRKQRIAAMTCYEMLMEAIMTGIESSMDKERIKQMMNDAINKAAEFFSLGNKKMVKARMKSEKGKRS